MKEIKIGKKLLMYLLEYHWKLDKSMHLYIDLKMLINNWNFVAKNIKVNLPYTRFHVN